MFEKANEVSFHFASSTGQFPSRRPLLFQGSFGGQSLGNVCVGASRDLQRLLAKDGVATELVRNRGLGGEMFHDFLRIKDYFGNGRDLIICPTWSQFAQAELRAFFPNPMFVGTYDELVSTSQNLQAIASQAKLPTSFPQGNASEIAKYFSKPVPIEK